MTTQNAPTTEPPTDDPPKLSDQLESWLTGDGEKTAGTLIEEFGERSFAILFVLLLALPALPLPTGGVTHVMEIIAALVALQLVVGRHRIWLPRRWRKLGLTGARQQRFVASLMKLIRRLERLSRPRMAVLFRRRFTGTVFGLLVLACTVGAFFAPPFSGLDTLPALGVVVISLGVLLQDFAIFVSGTLLGASGVVLEIALGEAAVRGVSSLF